ncbi:restriction endonuclease subunit S [Nocardia beijingensis]|uniref:restriction endonuclease subunit S n=1 Tax=Nocardia beijingensis TaxID=95162 RepID=UPI0033D01F49
MIDLLRMNFGDLGSIFDGPHATPTRRTEGPFFLNISSLKAGRLDLAESDRVSEEDFARWTKRVTPRPNDLLFSYETRIGEAALMPEGVRACLGRRMALLRPNPDIIDARFLLYFYLSPEFQQTIAQNTIHGATVPRIGLATMPSWPVAIPQLTQQRAIAEVLGALDDKIASNATIEVLTKELLSALFNQIGLDNPDGMTSRFDSLVSLNPTERLSGGEHDPVYVEMRNLPSGNITISNWDRRPARGGARFRNGDTLLARITPCLENGKVGYVDFLDDGDVAVGSTEFIVMRARADVPASLPYFVATSSRFREFAIRHMVGTTGRQRLSAADVALYEVAHPSSKALDQFDAIAQPLLRRVRAAVDESRILARTRDELLPLLMSGKLRVKDAEKKVEAIV